MGENPICRIACYLFALSFLLGLFLGVLHIIEKDAQRELNKTNLEWGLYELYELNELKKAEIHHIERLVLLSEERNEKMDQVLNLLEKADQDNLTVPSLEHLDMTPPNEMELSR